MSDGKSSGLDRKALKQKHLGCFGVHVVNMTAWQEAVREQFSKGSLTQLQQ
jgi:hypothetical protein